MKVNQKIKSIVGLCAIIALAVFTVSCKKTPQADSSAPAAKEAKASETAAKPEAKPKG